MRIVAVNLAYEPTLAESSSLLDRYHTLTGLARALTEAGARLLVVQRFSRDDELVRDGVRYRFVVDSAPAMLPPSATAPELVAAISAAEPDLVHVNGLMFPAMVKALRIALPRARIVVQDHSGISAPGRIDLLLDGSWRGLAHADAYSFTAAAYATPWRKRGLLDRDAPVFEIVEASTTLRPSPLPDARARTGLAGSPLILWVGRLNQNKDPLTVIRGLDDAFAELREARACFVYSDRTLETDLRGFVDRSPRLRERVSLAGRVAYEDMPLYYSAADFFVSGSRQEGSGYALIEAMACGVVPIVTDIPSFRVIAGDCGIRWKAGAADSLRNALLAAARFDRAAEAARVRERFTFELSWNAIAEQTLAAYRTLLG